MIFRRFEVGPLMVNCYLIGCGRTKIAAVIDPGDEIETVIREAELADLRIEQIINTHGHADHIACNREVKERTGAKIFIHPADSEMLTNPEKNLSIYFGPAITSPAADCYLNEGDIHKVGEIEFQILHTPGHSPGSICLVNNRKVIAGDTLFAGSIGRTDFPGGSFEELIGNIKSKLFPLGDKTEVFPGHGPPTNIGRERMHNPFLV